jgi:hypothetical protein
MKQAYGSWGYQDDDDSSDDKADGKPACEPKQFNELQGATCLDPHSGVALCVFVLGGGVGGEQGSKEMSAHVSW